MSKSFSDVGLPDGYKPSALAFHPPTRTLIAHVTPIKDMPPKKRLLFRWDSVTHYQSVGDFPDDVSIESFVLDPLRPSLYFVTSTWREIDGGRAAGDWDALYRFDLEEHRCEPLTRRGTLRPPAGYERTWLNDVLAVGPDGRVIFCKVGLCKTSRAEYWVAGLDVASLELKPVTLLEALFV